MSALIKKSTSLAVAVTKSSTATTTVQASNTETLVICMDCSGSMRDFSEGNKTRMDVALESASMLIRASSVLSHVGLVAFHDMLAEVVAPCVPRGTLFERLSGFRKHDGGTHFAPAVRGALREIASHKWGSIKRIIFLSDGEDFDNEESRRALIAVVNECADAKVIIDTVMFGSSPAGEATLKMMSEKTGGIFCLAKDAASLRRTFLSLEAGARGLLTGGKR